MLAGHCTADIVVVLRDAPTLDVALAIGLLVKTDFIAKESDKGKSPVECIPRPYGFDFAYKGACVRIAFTTNRRIANPEAKGQSKLIP